jgi:CheY-like chemotaxis protein
VRVYIAGAHAVCEVADTGRGIKPELLPELFECYRQGAAPPSGRAGLGLGLYIVRQLTQLHGGTVEARSDGEGSGSTFIVRLPLRETMPSVASEISLPDETGPDLEGMRVLVVEDEADARDLITAVLAGKGASVAVAENVDQAIAMFHSCMPDVLISDISMPGEDGCALVRRLRSESPGLPAIAVSGFAAAQDAARALDAGFDVHVPKPIAVADLVATIRDLARRGHASQSSV